MNTFTVFSPARNFLKITFLGTLALALTSTVHSAQSESSDFSSRIFCGSTPWDEPISKLLGIPTNNAPELMEWKLALHRHTKTLAPSHYELRCTYGLTTPGKPGIGQSKGTWERQGAWKIAKGNRINGSVYDLDGALSLWEAGTNVLQILNQDQSLMVGNGGWSYTLNATERAEKAVDPSLALTVPDMSYSISPVSTGATVLGVFEGRTPAHGIAHQLNIPIHEAATKAKWRVTLYQNPDSLAPVTYKIEGTLFRPAAREGKWSISKTLRKGTGPTVYELASSKGEPTLHLLKGDDNVLFFLDDKGQPLVGHCEFSYTLNRRTLSPAVTQVERRP